MRILTIGVYGYTEADFFAALKRARADLVCDIRRRRGVRGAQYAFANSRRLQARLAELGIGYLYCQQLSPSRATRQAQDRADAARRERKRDRQALDPAFVEAYRAECLASFSPRLFIDSLPAGVERVALLCVERPPAACHRSLLAERLAAEPDVEVEHLQ